MSFQTPITVYQAIDNITNNRYLLPAIQREFIWPHEKIEWLFDSIMRDYPISSFLFWQVESNTKKNYKFYKFLSEYRERFKTHNEEITTAGLNDFSAILDGQQRLTSLYIGLKGSFAYKIGGLWWDNTEYAIPTRSLYLNIQNPLKDEEDGRIYEFKFLMENEYRKESLKWFKVGEILEYPNIGKFIKLLDDEKYKNNTFAIDTLSKLQEVIFSKTIINYFLEKEQNIDKALNIFIRINSGGEPLNFSDILMSIAVANWKEKDAKKVINNLVDEIFDKGFLIKKDFVLKTFLLLYSNDIRFKVANFSKENAEEFEKKWDKIYKSIHIGFDLIKSFGFIDSWLTSKNAILPIIYYIYHKNYDDSFITSVLFSEERKIIKKWLHIVLVKRIFGAQSDQILSKIRNVFTSDFKKLYIDDSIVKFPFSKIQESLKGTSKDISFDDDFIDRLLIIQKDDNITFSILALLYPNLDYKNGNFHKDHLHPFSFFNIEKLKEYNIGEDLHSFYLNYENFNSILNMQLLDANENKSKQDKSLEEWVGIECKKQNVSLEKLCENHVFPDKIDFKDFCDFIKLRKILLKEKLKELII